MARSTGAPPTIGMAHVGLAEVGYERDELAAAAQHATVAIEQCRRLAYALALVAGLVTLARIRQAEGDPARRAGRRRRGRGRDAPVVGRPALSRVGAAGPAGAGRGEPRRGRSMGPRSAGSPWTTSRSIPASPSTGCSRGVLLAEHKPAAALELLERWRALALAQGRVGSVLRLRVLAALAHDARRRPARRAEPLDRGPRSRRAGGLPAGLPRRGRADRGAAARAAGRSAPRSASAAGSVRTGVPRPADCRLRAARHADPAADTPRRGDGARGWCSR